VARAVLLDVDGTLIDANYQHALAWYRAFRANGLVMPIWKIHRHVGMGGDQLVPALIGEEADAEKGEDIRETRKEIYEELIEEVAPLDGAHELIADLKERGRTAVLASSAPEKEIDHYLDLLEARDLADGWTTDDDVEATKPEPDLVRAALVMARTDEAVLVGDTPWDIESARKSGIETITVITGGYSEQELRDAGAVGVYESVQELRGHLEEPPFV
jgi:HAD superfamily hydrolase (TIGR01509 family)